MIEATAGSILQRDGVRQFVKFCVIGFTSMVIDVAIAYILTYRIGLNWALARTISFSVAVTNGFYWNSIWTFRGLGSGKRHELYMKFVAVNIAGLLLNFGIMKSIFFLFTGRIMDQGVPDRVHWACAMAVAVACVSLWNFIVNKRWTFK